MKSPVIVKDGEKEEVFFFDQYLIQEHGLSGGDIIGSSQVIEMILDEANCESQVANANLILEDKKWKK